MDISNLVNYADPTEKRFTMLVWGLYDADVGNWSSKRRIWNAISMQRDYHVKDDPNHSVKAMNKDFLNNFKVI